MAIKKLRIIVFIFVVVIGSNCFAEDISEIQLDQKDRILILAPHPDDEAIAVAGIIQEALRLNIPLKIVYLTNGDSNEIAFMVYKKRPVLSKKAVLKMGELRRVEAVNAMQFLGVEKENLVFLGYPDAGTMKIFNEFWDVEKPYKGALTRTRNVPYADAKSFGVSYAGENILDDLKDIVLEFRPTKIFVSHPGDTNSDHRALPLFLQVVLWDLEYALEAPEIYSYLIHHAGFPDPKGFHPELKLAPPEKFREESQQWREFHLTESQIQNKRNAIDYYKTQISYNPPYLYSFARKNELFGDYVVISLKKDGRIDWDSLEATENIFTERLNEFTENKEEIKSITYALKENSLKIRINSFQHLNSLSSINIYLNGYNYDIDFSSMPKYRINIKGGKILRIYEKNRLVLMNQINFKYDKKSMFLDIPLKILDDPHYIFTSTRSGFADLPKEAAAWRILEIE